MQTKKAWLSFLSISITMGLASCATPKVEKKPLEVLTPVVTQRAAEKEEKEKRDLFQLPARKPAVPLQLPPAHRARLDNGLSMIFIEDHALPLIDVMLLLPVGTIDDPPDKVGLADFLSSMLRQGTRRMKADRLSETVDAAGAALRASSGYEQTWIRCSGRRRSLELCLRLVADLAWQATIPAAEMGEIRDKLLGAVKQAYDDPATLAELHFNNLLFGDDHPAGRPMTVDSIQRITRSDLVEFYRRTFRPQRAILGLSGDLTTAQVMPLIKNIYRAWSPGNRSRRPDSATMLERQLPPVKKPPPGLKVLLVDKPDLSQSFFSLGHQGIKRTDSLREAVITMNYVLGGGGFSSRLMKVIRAEGGKTYGISSQFDMNWDDGSFVVQSFTKNEQLVEMLLTVRRQLEQIITHPPIQTELQAAQGQLAGGYVLRWQTTSSLLGQLLRAQQWGFPDSYVTEFPVRIDALTPKALAHAARATIFPKHLVAAVVGKAAVVAPQLHQAGIAFSMISYLDPISAQAREKKTRPQDTIQKMRTYPSGD